MESEIWKPIPGYEGLYEVSSFGMVKSKDRLIIKKDGSSKKLKGNILKLDILKNGYSRVTLCFNNISERFLVHRLVCLVFLDLKTNESVVINHKDYNKLNNCIDNLEIITSRENNTHSRKNKTSKYVGVCFKNDKYRKKNWYSSINIDSKIIFLGYYYTEKEAHEAYLNSLKEYGLENKYAVESQV